MYRLDVQFAIQCIKVTESVKANCEDQFRPVQVYWSVCAAVTLSFVILNPDLYLLCKTLLLCRIPHNQYKDCVHACEQKKSSQIINVNKKY